jgi:hypothetical protein
VCGFWGTRLGSRVVVAATTAAELRRASIRLRQEGVGQLRVDDSLSVPPTFVGLPSDGSYLSGLFLLRLLAYGRAFANPAWAAPQFQPNGRLSSPLTGNSSSSLSGFGKTHQHADGGASRRLVSLIHAPPIGFWVFSNQLLWAKSAEWPKNGFRFWSPKAAGHDLSGK